MTEKGRFQAYWGSILVVLLGVGGLITAARAGVGTGMGGDSPFPFHAANQKVELADGEPYLLIGTIRFVEGEPHLEVDLEEHPWLANRKRRAHPYYRIEAHAEHWRKYDGLRMKTFMEAHAQIDDRALSPADAHQLVLQPLAEPVRIEAETQFKARRSKRK